MARRQTTLNLWLGKPAAKDSSPAPLRLDFGKSIQAKPAKNGLKQGIHRSTDDDVVAVEENGEDEDAWMVMAMEASRAEFEREKAKRSNMERDGPSTSASGSANSNQEVYAGFDNDAGKVWIYPTNFPIRKYQFEIINKALFYNTLVTLPTGLGKTFIAAVVMYNFYRWYPSGKVVFMAPTKPLVAQQVEACYNIMGIPQEHVAEMTGSIAPAHRKKLWNEKRVFFLTPQVIQNDLQHERFPAESVKCVVIDEAHKATGDHAYCQVIRHLLKHTKQFRVLALSATPGSDLAAVQSVLSNLTIAHMELRSEESPEIRQYTHERNIECIVVPITGDLAMLRDKYEKVLQTSLNYLTSRRVLFAMSVQTCSLTALLAARINFRTQPPPGLTSSYFGSIEGAFASAIGLLHGYHLLSNMGMKSLYSYFQGKIGGDKATPVRRALNNDSDLREIYEFLRERFASDDAERAERLRFPAENESFFDRSHAAAMLSTQQVSDTAASSHPKLVKLVEVLIDHFKAHAGRETRVMVFAQYRDCVEEITELLKKRRPLIKPMKFVGQASSKPTAKGISQKEQLKVVKDFKEGGYNTLVSTSVGEEGLDIGEVDLIVCYDATASPVRSVQRMGRTGRKRQGRIVMLVTEGREQSIFHSSEYSKKRVHKAILANKKFELYVENRRMVPCGLLPTCVKMHTTLQKPYENPALRKRNENTGGAGSNALKKFTGSLTEKELNEWERDFKLRDTEPPTNLLGERKPLRLIGPGAKKAARIAASYVNESGQDRPQRSVFVQSSLLRHAFVKMSRACRDASSRDMLPEMPYFNEITKPCKPCPQIQSKRIIVSKENIEQPKSKRRRKAKPIPGTVRTESCQLIAEFKSINFHVTASGEQLNLTDIFPEVGAVRNAASIGFGYSEAARKYEISALTARMVMNAMVNDAGDS